MTPLYKATLVRKPQFMHWQRYVQKWHIKTTLCHTKCNKNDQSLLDLQKEQGVNKRPWLNGLSGQEEV